MSFTDEDLTFWRVLGGDNEFDDNLEISPTTLKALINRLDAAEKVITVGHTKACWTARGLACVCKWGDAVEAWKKSAGR